MQLNFGCGFDKKEGFVNVDLRAECDPDMIVDLEDTPWPWDSNSVEYIEARHVLEHLGQQTEVFLNIIKELYRVLVPNGVVKITVPHPRSDNYLNDPTHVRPITAGIFNLFSKEFNRKSIENKWSSTPLGLYCDVDFELVSSNFVLSGDWGKRWEVALAAQDMQAQEAIARAIQTDCNVADDIEIVIRKC